MIDEVKNLDDQVLGKGEDITGKYNNMKLVQAEVLPGWDRRPGELSSQIGGRFAHESHQKGNRLFTIFTPMMLMRKANSCQKALNASLDIDVACMLSLSVSIIVSSARGKQDVGLDR